jgi:hypothetical protein
MSQPADEGGAANVWSPSRLPELRFRWPTAYLLFDSETSILVCLVVCAFGT